MFLEKKTNEIKQKPLSYGKPWLQTSLPNGSGGSVSAPGRNICNLCKEAPSTLKERRRPPGANVGYADSINGTD